jgi:inner membrane protein
MATVFSHPAVALGLMPWFRDVRNSKAVLFTGMLLTILPDIDVLAFKLGIPYAHFFGHRGFTHSLLFAAMISAGCAWLFCRFLRKPFLNVWVFLFLCAASHGIIDAFTNGGLGIALFSPFDDGRYFSPQQPIEVSTLSVRRFFQGQGIGVLISELKWIWLPCMILMIIGLGGLFIGKRRALKAS